MVFAESGLLVGFFLPGDSLLFTAGFLASQGVFYLPILMALCFIAAVTGDSVGYAFGHRVGRRIFNRPESLLFHRHNLLRAEKFYEQHGGKAIVLARFLPVIRTFAPILAGVGAMHYKTFLAYNVLGGALWAIGLPLLGYFLGSFIPDPDRYLLPVVVLIITLSIMPTLFHILRTAEDRRRVRQALQQVWQKIRGTGTTTARSAVGSDHQDKEDLI